MEDKPRLFNAVPDELLVRSDPIQVICTSGAGQQCALNTFEGPPCFAPIGVVPSCFTTATFDSSWFTAIEDDVATGCANARNLPSPITLAGTSSSSSDISFSNPVASVNLFYATLFNNVTITAFNASSSIVATATGPVNNFSTPVTIWSPLGVRVNSNTITKVTITGLAEGYAIDNLMICQLVSTPTATPITNAMVPECPSKSVFPIPCS